ncbi:type I toxin-antitoxin system Ibs family toxin [Citrobacter freundii]|uniref:type I toxin-antitoxin system Ibs family toxin n=1 Tax=Citrobacter freundii TaxID=546 RepID=UPI001A28EFAD|nr:type I toxin-antitoxin system Ibs family toxin [Citrobacter freundii]MDK2359474.1 type I toxin-antitoxin system Ibs family toxin [Citrobacter freundii]HAU4329974.1 type I toxin-antitoxin system Ibs family toxin [Citrobacter freundii]
MMKRVIILIVLLLISFQLINSQSEGEKSPLTLIPALRLKKQQRQQEEAHRNEKFGAFPAFITYRCLSGSF